MPFVVVKLLYHTLELIATLEYDFLFIQYRLQTIRRLSRRIAEADTSEALSR